MLQFCKQIADAAVNTARCNTRYPNIVYNDVKVIVDLKGMTAGYCDASAKFIRINEVLTKHEHLADELERTILHEVAHAVDIMRHGHRKNGNKFVHHDHIFYTICRELGIPDETRTHDIKELVSTRKYREFEYRLRKLIDGEWKYMVHNGKPVCETLKTIRHNKLQKGKVEYYQWSGGKRAYKVDFVREII